MARRDKSNGGTAVEERGEQQGSQAAESRTSRSESRGTVVHTELSYGSFMRSIPLPDGADENRLSATMRNGSLEITVPIAARERGRRVKVQHS
jgi:HSP20 family protein